MLQYLEWEPLSERRTKARLIIMYRIIKGKVAIPIDTADLQPGRRGRFIQHTRCYQQYKTVFIHGLSVIGTYYHPGLQILPLFGQFQEQTTRLLLLSWYLHRLVVISIWVKRVFISIRQYTTAAVTFFAS